MICDCYPFLEAPFVSRRTVRCPMPKREKRNELVRVAFSRFQISPDMESDVNLATSLWLCHRLSNSFIYSSPGNALNNHSPMSFSSSSASTSSSPSSSSSSPRNVHPASQVDPASHSQALIDLLELDISREVIGTHSYTLHLFLVSLSCFRICCRLCRRDSWLCHGS